MRRAAILVVDLGWVALTAFLAVLLRENFVVDPAKLVAVAPYVATAVVVSALVFVAARLNKTLWQYTSLPDVLRIVGAVTVALLMAVFVSFVLNRLEGVARSVPVIQMFLLVGGMIGSRVAVRVWHEHGNRHDVRTHDRADHYVLVVGVSRLTELYLEAAAEYGPKSLHIVGLLSDRREFHERLLRRQRILGTPEDLLKVLAQLEVHGITVNQIIVMQTFAEVSSSVREALLTVERTGSVKVAWLVERLDLTDTGISPEMSVRDFSDGELSFTSDQLSPWLGRHRYAKRVFDIAGVLVVTAFFAPVITIIALLVALDVGFPLVFWQQRPGRYGCPFKLFKFRTMSAGHDRLGNRQPDEQRSSIFGSLLRKTKLDELPQLYNVFIGEMSLVGPRPLLPKDQPSDVRARLATRPGVTGFAQVNGGPDISADDKNMLDLWYVQNASLWLDIEILFRTLIVLIVGERTNEAALSAARARVESARSQDTADREAESHLSSSAEGRVVVATADR